MKKLLLFHLFIYTFLLGAEPTDLTCPAPVQTNSTDALWKCPSLNNPDTYSDLTDIDLVSGTYVCTYRYKNGGRMATSCQFTSKTYVDHLKETTNKLDQLTKNHHSITFDADANFIPGEAAPEAIKTIETLTNETTEKLNTLYNTAITNKEGGISAVNSDIASMQQTIYDHLKRPYLLKDANYTTIKKGDTFGRFIVGLATLDPDVVKGYNEENGNLMITQSWKNKASAISSSEQGLIDKLKSFLPWTDDDPMVGLGDIMKEQGNNENTLDSDVYNIASWIDIFTMKIWGYYYNLQRNFDIGYDELSTSMLFFFLVFFAGSLALRGGTKFAFTKKHNTNNKFHLTDAGTMKIISIMGIFVILFLSIPSDISSNNTVTNQNDIKHEMTTNGSIFKHFIRYAAKEGSYFGDMFSDLGTSAFLNYVIKKQGLYTGNEIRSLFNADVRQMAYYYPSLQIARECEASYGADFNKFIGRADLGRLSVQPNYTSDFMTGNNIGEINFDLCKNMHKNLILIPNTIAKSAATTEARIDNVDKIRAKATKYLVENHVLLQDKLGWVNIVSIPYTYFMMKFNDLFFEQDLDYDQIAEKTEQYINNTGIKSGWDVSADDTSWWNNFDTQAGKARDKAARGSAYVSHFMTKFAYYNFLPGFTSIKETIYKQIKGDDKDKDSILDDYLNKIPFPFMKKKILKSLTKETVLQVVSYFTAIVTWKEALKSITLSVISLMFTANVLLAMFFLSVLIMITPFMVAWAFAGSRDVGVGKIKIFARNTLLIAFSPVMLVIASALYIFINGAFEALATFMNTALIEQQMNMVSLAIVGSNTHQQDAFLSYLTLYSIKDIIEISLMLLSIVIAGLILFKFASFVKKLMGIDDGGVSSGDQITEDITRQGDKNVNPFSR